MNCTSGLSTNAKLDAVALANDGRSGALALSKVYDFLGRFIVYPNDAAHVAHTLWVAHVHLIGAFDSTPRLAFLSAEPASGKTRALEITELLVPKPIEAVNMSPPALFRLVATDDAMLPTILYDEIDTVFGPKAKDHEEIRGLINAGHRRGAKTFRCVIVGKKVEVESIEAFCPVALAGLGWLPDTIVTRSVVVRMKRRAPGETVEPYRRRDFAAAGAAIRVALETWAGGVKQDVCSMRPALPEGIVDRSADCWEPLLAVADAAGGEWPGRARAAAVAIVREGATDHLPSLGVQLLADLRSIWGGVSAKATDDILAELRSIPEAPWADMRGKPIDARRLANLLRQYGVKSKTIRVGGNTPKGYARDDLFDAWARNLPPLSGKSATSATAATSVSDQTHGVWRQGADVADDPPHVADGNCENPAKNGHVSHVAHVADFSSRTDEPLTCAHCGGNHRTGTLQQTAWGGEQVFLHSTCIEPFLAAHQGDAADDYAIPADGSIPRFLRREQTEAKG